MGESTYITIMDWMVSLLHLSGNELVVYAIIHGFSQDGESVFWGSVEYLSQKSGASPRCITDVLKKLVQKGLLVKRITKQYFRNLSDGTQQLKKAQGGANHFCIYYTAISRSKTFPDIIASVHESKEYNIPTAKSAYGNNNPTAEIAYGINNPTEDSAVGKSNPTAEIAHGTTANSSYVAKENSAYNNKFNNKSNTTTNNNETTWNPEILDATLIEIFGSGGLFTYDFIKKCSEYLTSKQLNYDSGKRYLNWAFEQARSKANKDSIGYFVSTVMKDTFYYQFCYNNNNKASEEKKDDVKLLCPICNHSFNKSLSVCPHCHTEVSDFSNESLIYIKKQINQLSDEKRHHLEKELDNLAQVILQGTFKLPGKVNISELEIKEMEDNIYSKYGICRR